MPSSLPHKLTIILVIKLIALMGIYWLFFSPVHRVSVDAEKVQTRFYAVDADQLSGAP